MTRLFSGLAGAMRAVAAVGIAAAVLLNLAQIVWRYVLFSPLSWTEEAMRYLLVWVTMLGVAAALYRGEEAAAGMLGWVPGRRVQAALHGLRILLVAAFGAGLLWYGIPFALAARNQVSPAAQIPMVLPYAAFAVGGALIAVMALGMAVAPWRPGAGESDRPEDEVRPEDVS